MSFSDKNRSAQLYGVRVLPRIRCARCGTLCSVRLEIAPYGRSSTIFAMCHGEIETMELTQEQLARMPMSEMLQWRAIAEGRTEGVAFVTPTQPRIK